MSFKNYLGFLAAILVMAGTFSPMLHLPVIGNWSFWDLDMRMASIVFLFGAAGFLSSIFKRPRFLRFCGFAIVLLLALTLLAVYMKVHSSFSFIPLKKLAAVAAGIVHYRWSGWMVQLLGAMAMIGAGRREARNTKIGIV